MFKFLCSIGDIHPGIQVIAVLLVASSLTALLFQTDSALCSFFYFIYKPLGFIAICYYFLSFSILIFKYLMRSYENDVTHINLNPLSENETLDETTKSSTTGKILFRDSMNAPQEKVNSIFPTWYKHLEYKSYFTLANILSVIVCTSLALHIALFRRLATIPYFMLPLAVYTISITIMCCWKNGAILIRIGRAASAPLISPKFEDTLFTDILSSVTKNLADLAAVYYILCTNIRVQDLSDVVLVLPRCFYTTILPIVLCVPGFWRCMQCIRKAIDDRTWLPLANVLKYSLIILATYLAAAMRNAETSDLILPYWKVLMFIASIYSCYWDLCHDFELLKKDQYCLRTREDLLFKEHSIYYIIMLVNIIIRFSWLTQFVWISASYRTDLYVLCLQLLEILRRSIWSLLRMEWECSNYIQTRVPKKTS